MTGTLYVVPTPLGNLDDITLRAVRTLGSVSAVIAEDTRRTRKLLTHLGIRTHLSSYHQHSKTSAIADILLMLEEGDVALVSDAGTPSIADPGFELVVAAVREGVRVEALPGPSAVITSVVLAALPAKGFIFVGFLPRRRSDAETRLREVGHLPYALVVFESPRRLTPSIDLMISILGDRDAAAVHEISKVHEGVVRGSLSSIAHRLRADELRGEWTLVVGPAAEANAYPDDSQMKRALVVARDQGVSGRDAVILVSEALGINRSDVYSAWVQLGVEDSRSRVSSDFE